MDWNLIIAVGVTWTAASFVLGMALGQFIHWANEYDEALWKAVETDWRTGHNRPPVAMLIRSLG